MWCRVVHPCHITSKLLWIAAVIRPCLFTNVAQAVSWVTWEWLNLTSCQAGEDLFKQECILRGNKCRNSKLGPKSSRKCFFQCSSLLRLGLLSLAHTKERATMGAPGGTGGNKGEQPQKRAPSWIGTNLLQMMKKPFSMGAPAWCPVLGCGLWHYLLQWAVCLSCRVWQEYRAKCLAAVSTIPEAGTGHKIIQTGVV